MSYDYYGIIFIFIYFFKSTYASTCWNVQINNQTFGHIENWNYYLGKSQPKNLSCSWIIHNENQQSIQSSYYLISLRLIEIEYDRKIESHELVLKTNQKQLIINNINQRIFYIPSSYLEIYFQKKSQSNSLNIQRFSLEFSHINNNYNHDNYFHCHKSGLIIPKQWICNCLYECLYDDDSDEQNCSICSMIKSSNNLLCHSNEVWCLPVTDQSNPKGVCFPSDQTGQCSYSAYCETILSYTQDHGDFFVDNFIISNRESLCFIIVTEEKHKIKLNIDQYNFINERPDLELIIYDGSERHNQILISSNSIFMKQTVQTREHHVATIVIRKRFIQYQNILLNQQNQNDILLNITWSTSLCLNNQFPCSTQYELKCYNAEQRCDGIWDCISGDDEIDCLPSSCPNTFDCHDPLILPSDHPRCYTWYERCNGNAFCISRHDEQNCTNWWCNSNNGTFLCKNLNCIYEIWVCDGSNDCGDNSDEMHCPKHISRRNIAAAVIGATICSTLFLIAFGCTCKFLHLRSSDQRTSNRLLNPQQYIEQRRLNRPETAIDNTTDDDTRRLAPPSYNQTMGFMNNSEERYSIIAEHLRLAGLANLIPRTNSEQRHRRHHRHQQTYHEDSREVLIETSTNRLDRFRSLFIRNLSINNNNNNNNLSSDELNRSEHHPIIHSTRERPPPYSQEQLSLIHHENDLQSSMILTHIHKRQIPLNPIENHFQEQPSSSSITTRILDNDDDDDDDDDKQASCDMNDDDDDDKMLLP